MAKLLTFYNRLEGQIHRRLLNRCVCGKKIVNGVKRTFMTSVWVGRDLVVLSFKWSSHLSRELISAVDVLN